jgi:hypothetical protein
VLIKLLTTLTIVGWFVAVVLVMVELTCFRVCGLRHPLDLACGCSRMPHEEFSPHTERINCARRLSYWYELSIGNVVAIFGVLLSGHLKLEGRAFLQVKTTSIRTTGHRLIYGNHRQSGMCHRYTSPNPLSLPAQLHRVIAASRQQVPHCRSIYITAE